MALFPVNQNVQWFTPTSAEITELKKVANTSTLLKKDAGKVWFTATSGAHQHRSEVVDIKNGGFIKYVAEADMEYAPKYVTITFDGTVSNPINGEVYGIYLNQRGYNALGERHYMELGAEVRYGSKFNFDANSDLSISAGEAVINSVRLLMVALQQAFVRNLGSKDDELYTVTVASSATNAGVITIKEKEQDWIQGLMQNEHLILEKQDVHLSVITVNTLDRDDWATIAEGTDTSNKLKNSKDIADMEWFYLGEHGDQQRLMGYPYANAATIKGTIYNINPKSAAGYDLIYIHHAYVGNGTFVQKSEKDIMIAVPVNSTDGRDIADQIAIALGVSGVDGSSTHVASKKVYTF